MRFRLGKSMGLERTRYWSASRAEIGDAALLAQRAARATFRDLWDGEFRVFSQWGEDGIFAYLCDCLEIDRPRMVEFGAGDFSECNSRYLAVARQAAVLMVDSNTGLIPHVRELETYWRTTLIPVQAWITPTTAPRLMLDAHNQLGGVDILSVDIDGNDYWVVDALDLVGVSIVVVEYNPLFGPSSAVSVPRDDNFNRADAHWSCLYFGASLSAWIHLLGERGFEFVGTNRAGNNAFFVAAALRPLVPLDPSRVRELARFTDWRVRESRGEAGEMTYLTRLEAASLIADLPLVEVRTGEPLAVRQVSV